VLPPDIALVVVGGPTHAHGMSTSKTRADAIKRAADPLVSKGPGMREWVASLRPAPGVLGAAFDTRIKGPTLFTGSAATRATRLLRESGLGRVEQPRSFVLDGPTGPLVDRVPANELEAARAWGVSLAAEASST
jgi:hypothetical protein